MFPLDAVSKKVLSFRLNLLGCMRQSETSLVRKVASPKSR